MTDVIPQESEGYQLPTLTFKPSCECAVTSKVNEKTMTCEITINHGKNCRRLKALKENDGAVPDD